MVVLSGAVLAGAAYVIASVFGFSAIAASVGQLVFWALWLSIAAGVVCVAILRNRRASGRANARAAGSEVNALYLGQRPGSISEKTVDAYSAFPPERSTEKDSTPLP